MSEENVTVTVEDKKALLDAVVQISLSLGKIDTEREHIKDIAQGAEDTFGIKKKYINKMAKVMHAKTFADLREESSHFESLYEIIIGERDQFEGQ